MYIREIQVDCYSENSYSTGSNRPGERLEKFHEESGISARNAQELDI